jgi:methionyl-tRNA formyltransferase
MGTPEFAVPSLQALIDTQNVVGVVTQPDRPAGRGRVLKPSPVKTLAEEAGIPVYQPRSLRSLEAAQPLREWRPDAIVVAAFGQILRPHVLDLPPLGCVNVHASLLPRWRGASPIQHALLAGDAQTGITLMRMEVGLDTGPIFVQEAIEIDDKDTAATLHDGLALLGAKMVATYLGEILSGSLVPQPQDDALATYAPMIDKENGRLDWTLSSSELDRQVRAMTPWPGAFTTWDGQMLKILAAHPLPDARTRREPGQVFKTDEYIAVQTGAGALVVDRLQLAGKNALDASAFMRGRPEFGSATLGS